MPIRHFLHSLPRNGHTRDFILPHEEWRPSLSFIFQTDEHSNDYTRGLSTWPFISIIILLIAVFGWIVFQISKCYKRLQSTDEFQVVKVRGARTRNQVIVLLVCSFASGLVISLACLGSMWDTLDGIFDDVDHSADVYANSVSELESISDNINHCMDLTRDIEINGISNGNPETLNFTRPIDQLLEAADDLIIDIVEEGRKIDWHIKDNGAESGLYGFLAAVCVVSSLLFLASLIESFPCQTFFCFKCSWMIISTIFLTALYIVILMQFSLSTILSDGCNDEVDTIEQIYDRYDKPWDPFYYYIQCDESTPFPWEEEYHQTVSILNSVSDATALVIVKFQPEGQTLYGLSDLKNTTDDTIDSLNKAYEGLLCDYYHEVYEDISSDLCNKTIDLWFTIYFFHIMMLVFLCCAKVLNSNNVKFRLRYFSRLEESFDDRNYGGVDLVQTREPPTFTL